MSFFRPGRNKFRGWKKEKKEKEKEKDKKGPSVDPRRYASGHG